MQSSWRVACVRVPRFALRAVWQHRQREVTTGRRASHDDPVRETRLPPAPCDSLPVVLVRDGRVIDATPAARSAGLRFADASARRGAQSTAVEWIEWDAAAVDVEVTRGTALYVTASPHVTPVAGAPGMWWVGIGGPDQGGGERGTVRAIARVARRLHPAARIGVASSCVAARAAVWGDAPGAAISEPSDPMDERVCIVPRGGCAAFIASAPIGFVPMDATLRRTLLAGGIRTVGALAALAPADVERQWGAAGAAAWRIARGDDRRRPVLTCGESRRVVSVELASPATSPAPVLALVHAALDRLTAQLADERRLAVAVSLTLTLDDGRGAHPAGGIPRTATRELRLPCPLASAATIASRCAALLARWAPEPPVCGVRVEITASAPVPNPPTPLLAWPPRL